MFTLNLKQNKQTIQTDIDITYDHHIHTKPFIFPYTFITWSVPKVFAVKTPALQAFYAEYPCAAVMLIAKT